MPVGMPALPRVGENIDRCIILEPQAHIRITAKQSYHGTFLFCPFYSTTWIVFPRPPERTKRHSFPFLPTRFIVSDIDRCFVNKGAVDRKTGNHYRPSPSLPTSKMAEQTVKFHLLYSSNIKCGRRNIGYGYKDAGTDKENISAFSHKMCIILLTRNHELNIEIFDKEKSCLNNSVA